MKTEATLNYDPLLFWQRSYCSLDCYLNMLGEMMRGIQSLRQDVRQRRSVVCEGAIEPEKRNRFLSVVAFDGISMTVQLVTHRTMGRPGQPAERLFLFKSFREEHQHTFVRFLFEVSPLNCFQGV